MQEYLIEYLKKYPNKRSFFINDMLIDINLPEPIVSKHLEELIKENPSLGSYDRRTGWLLLERPVKVNTVRIFFLLLFTTLFFILFSIIAMDIPLLYISLIFFVIVAIFNKVYDDMCYLKDFKL